MTKRSGMSLAWKVALIILAVIVLFYASCSTLAVCSSAYLYEKTSSTSSRPTTTTEPMPAPTETQVTDPPVATTTPLTTSATVPRSVGGSVATRPAFSVVTQSTKPSPDGRPKAPSFGKVLSAINDVLRGARNCVSNDEPLTHATVTFQSDGTVKSVSITGDAIGKPAEKCIKDALARATVPPFSDPSYATPVTVRPNP